MDTMTTVSEVLNNLKAKGYTVDFNLDDNCVVCHSNALKIYPEDFVVDKHYRFEGPSDPADAAIVYAISSAKHNLKGTLVDGYGTSSSKLTHNMIKALTMERKTNESTSLRPEGARSLDAAMVTMDLSSLTIQIKEEDTYKKSDRNAITIFKTDGMRIVLMALKKGAELKTHTAPGIISVQVLEGYIDFSTELQKSPRKTAQMLTLHAGIPHSVLALEDSVFLLTLAAATK
ncbi:cupin domain-containing protein [Pedobacter sp. SAFR-022]|uniref:cupin domain-containing protein n=1 Tax=Pedobacter sp. SAFR-022 TaxID=3436861 RepID=UPI003F81D6DE